MAPRLPSKAFYFEFPIFPAPEGQDLDLCLLRRFTRIAAHRRRRSRVRWPQAQSASVSLSPDSFSSSAYERAGSDWAREDSDACGLAWRFFSGGEIWASLLVRGRCKDANWILWAFISLRHDSSGISSIECSTDAGLPDDETGCNTSAILPNRPVDVIHLWSAVHRAVLGYT